MFTNIRASAYMHTHTYVCYKKVATSTIKVLMLMEMES